MTLGKTKKIDGKRYVLGKYTAKKKEAVAYCKNARKNGYNCRVIVDKVSNGYLMYVRKTR